MLLNIFKVVVDFGITNNDIFSKALFIEKESSVVQQKQQDCIL